MGAPQILQFEWMGQQVSLPLSHELYMQIEDRVSVARLGNCMANLYNGQFDVPLSHVAYVIYCCLRNAGVSLKTPAEVMPHFEDGKLKWADIIRTLVIGYYGAIPKAATEERLAKKPRSSVNNTRRNTRRSN